MDAKTGLIQIGDVIFESLGSQILRRIVINRITETQAVSGNTKFDRTVINSYVRVLGGRYAMPYRYQIATPELELKWRQTLAIRRIKNTDLGKLPIAQLEAIAALCG